MVFIQIEDNQVQEIDFLKKTDWVELYYGSDLPSDKDWQKYEAVLLLSPRMNAIDFSIFGKCPVIINEVESTLTELLLPENVCRINGWPGFLERKVWEIAGKNSQALVGILEKWGIRLIEVKDTAGLVSARVISMIINEAYYALNEKVSTAAEIDLAMRLGTNYPYGPFEWAEKIGKERVYNLLKKLSESDTRCIPVFIP